jgi:hypothetical protein
MNINIDSDETLDWLLTRTDSPSPLRHVHVELLATPTMRWLP